MATPALTSGRVAQAAAELASMRKSLMAWLKYRAINDRILAGTQPNLRMPPGHAKRLVAASRDLAIDQDLADKLHALLEQLMPDARLPTPDIRQNPNAAVELAKIAITGQAPVMAQATTMGASTPWMWPALIVGGLLLAITTAIKSVADVAKERERFTCIKSGGCTDYGFWLKAGGVAALVWFAWRELGVGELVKSKIKKGRSTT
jgi:hypothetical protein